MISQIVVWALVIMGLAVAAYVVAVLGALALAWYGGKFGFRLFKHPHLATSKEKRHLDFNDPNAAFKIGQQVKLTDSTLEILHNSYTSSKQFLLSYQTATEAYEASEIDTWVNFPAKLKHDAAFLFIKAAGTEEHADQLDLDLMKAQDRTIANRLLRKANHFLIIQSIKNKYGQYYLCFNLRKQYFVYFKQEHLTLRQRKLIANIELLLHNNRIVRKVIGHVEKHQ